MILHFPASSNFLLLHRRVSSVYRANNQFCRAGSAHRFPVPIHSVSYFRFSRFSFLAIPRFCLFTNSSFMMEHPWLIPVIIVPVFICLGGIGAYLEYKKNKRKREIKLLKIAAIREQKHCKCDHQHQPVVIMQQPQVSGKSLGLSYAI